MENTENTTQALYSINVANKMGHQTFELALDEAVSKLMELFKESKKWIFVGEEIFIPKAKFNNSDDDVALIEGDRNRLRQILSSKTSVNVDVPGGWITPSVAVSGELKGGE